MFCLRVATDSGWAPRALRDLDALLVDHAHCELKAASNALSLAMRHGTDVAIVRALTELAREEIEHFQRVLGVLSSRGTVLGPPSIDSYAADLRKAAIGLPRDRTAAPLVDRLLVGAMIEARSCERFRLLAEAVGAAGAEARPGEEAVGALWRDLFASEAAHYRTFVDLAILASGGLRGPVTRRLERLAEAEGAIVRALDRAPEATSRAAIHG